MRVNVVHRISAGFLCALGMGAALAKPALNEASLTNFSHIMASADDGISHDGEYVVYRVVHQNDDSQSLILQSTSTGWKREIPDSKLINGWFTGDNHYYLYLQEGSLHFVSLGDAPPRPDITGVTSVMHPNDSSLPSYGLRLSRAQSQGWWAYQRTGEKRELILHSDTGKGERHYEGVDEYAFEDPHGWLVLKSTVGGVHRLSVVHPGDNDNRERVVWESRTAKASQYQFSPNGRQIAFLTEEGVEPNVRTSLWYYAEGLRAPILKVNDETPGMEVGFKVKSTTCFIGSHILFTLERPAKEVGKPVPSLPKINVWSWMDRDVQVAQPKSPQATERWGYIGIASNRVSTFAQSFNRGQSSTVGHLHLVTDIHNYDGTEGKEKYWFDGIREHDQWLVDLDTGERRELPPFRKAGYYVLTMGPTYALLTNSNASHSGGPYASYEYATGRIRDISAKVPYSFAKDEPAELDPLRTDDGPGSEVSSPYDFGAVGRLRDTESYLVYDEYDIWSLDPTGKRDPVNLTNGYGRRHHLQLRPIDRNSVQGDRVGSHDLVVLSATNPTGESGYVRTRFDRPRDPEVLTLKAVMWGDDGQGGGGVVLRKARDADMWVVGMQTASESPNLYVTRDLRTFTALTDVHPERAYNWLSAEAVAFRQRDGIESMAVLYKPEDFDPTKKYPVIFYYYERLSDRMHAFELPGWSSGAINIPWFVSHGYLVCTPDIHNTLGRTGKSAQDAVEGAALELSKRGYVDAAHLGLQGHSEGGFETNYIASHSQLFAAAAEAAGMSDLTMFYLSLRGAPGRETNSQGDLADTSQAQPYWRGEPFTPAAELRQYNSALAALDRMTMPLLIMHNRADANVNWSEGVAMYLGLRRLRKPVWMLEYDGEAHTVDEPANARDYTIRLEQFFDHYLKGAPQPRWMAEGIPPYLKQIETRYELVPAAASH